MRPEEYAKLGYAPLPGGYYNSKAIKSTDVAFEVKAEQRVTARTTAAIELAELNDYDDDELLLRQLQRDASRIATTLSTILNDLLPACERDDRRQVEVRAGSSWLSARAGGRLFGKGFNPNAELQHCLMRMTVEWRVALQHNADAERALMRISKTRGFDGLRTCAEDRQDYSVDLSKFEAKFKALSDLIEKALLPEKMAEYFGAVAAVEVDRYQQYTLKPDAYRASMRLENQQLCTYAARILTQYESMDARMKSIDLAPAPSATVRR